VLCDCGYDTKVIDTRYDDRQGTIRRRRQCLKCGERFSTTEQRERTSSDASHLKLDAIQKEGK
jgi:transcriptional regulator NrdR family protein